jgi:rhodanese-related sulfurtransferase
VITRTELESLMAEGRRVVVLDVRTADEFARGTVFGARNVTAAELPDAIAGLPRDAVVVAVCNHGGSRSQGAAQVLRDAGLDARFLVGGVHGSSPGDSWTR